MENMIFLKQIRLFSRVETICILLTKNIFSLVNKSTQLLYAFIILQLQSLSSPKMYMLTL